MTRRKALRFLAGGVGFIGASMGILPEAGAGQRRQGRNRNGQGRRKRNAQSEPSGSAQPPSDVNTLVQAFMTKTGTPGVAVAIYEAGAENIYCWGNARTDPSTVPVTTDTVFGIGSVTKVFTTTLLACRVGAPGSDFALDDPVIKHLPAAVRNQHKDIGKVTLKMLATHTSDFPRSGPPGEDLFNDKPASTDLLTWWESWTDPKVSTIGTRYAYSNLGMVTLGYAVARNNYNTMLQRNICQPLGMGHTAPASFLPADSILAQGHVAKGNRLVAIDTQNADLNSSPQDMLIYLKAQLGVMRVPPMLKAAITLTHQPQFTPPPNAKGPTMGLGWQISKGATKVYSKDGGTTKGGCSCWIGHCPTKKVGLVIMANSFGTGSTSGASASTLGSSLFKTVFGISLSATTDET